MIVDCDYRKWGGIPHWRFKGELLGRDEHGTWIAGRPPTAYTGPMGAGEWTYPFVCLIPENGWWAATFYGPDQDVEVYVDMTTPAEWVSDGHVTMVDLDLDVIRSRTRGVMLDDEDEFIEHQTLYGYPDDIVAATTACAEQIMAMVAAREEPFGEASGAWLAR